MQLDFFSLSLLLLTVSVALWVFSCMFGYGMISQNATVQTVKRIESVKHSVEKIILTARGQ